MTTQTTSQTSNLERFYGVQTDTLGVPSEKMINFLFRLADDRVATSLGSCGEERIENLAAWFEARPTRRRVNEMIDWFKRQPMDTAAQATKPASEPTSAPLTPGVFERDGEVYVVKYNREKTRMYAKRLVEIGGARLTEADEHVNFDFEYAPGAIHKLAASDRMPLERAKQLMIRYGRCISCGRRLKAAVSVERGIGPVCGAMFS
jgi:hypothetical protein